MRKYYSFETMDSVLNEKLTVFLKAANIQYEKSGCGSGWHFETYCNSMECQIVNDFLDGYFDSIA